MSEKKYLDSSGLIRLVANIINNFSDKDHAHAISDVVNLQTELDGLQSSIDSIDGVIDNIESGDVVVAEATHAITADNATNATNANHAVSADSATNADNADYATEAGNADYAASAGSATKATQDGNGKVIADTYETKTDASAKLAEAKRYTDSEVADLNEAIDLKADVTDFNESIIALSVSGTTVTYIKGDGSTHTFETQDTDTTYSLGTDETTGLTKLYATTGSAEDGTMTQKAIKTELDKKVGVTIDDSNNSLVFTI